MASKNTSLESEIVEQLTAIETKISQLKSEEIVLQKLLLRIRSESISPSEVSRKNSIKRILAEAKIKDVLDRSPGPVSSRDLLHEAKRIQYDLKENTFRSYLHRLKQRDEIQPSKKRRGYWELKTPSK